MQMTIKMKLRIVSGRSKYVLLIIVVEWTSKTMLEIGWHLHSTISALLSLLGMLAGVKKAQQVARYLNETFLAIDIN